MKVSKSNGAPDSLKARQAEARFGKGAGRPLCLAALDYWQRKRELSATLAQLSEAREVRDTATKIKQEALALANRFRDRDRLNETNRAAAVWRDADTILTTSEKSYTAATSLVQLLLELLTVAAERFDRELDKVEHAGDAEAVRDLTRVKKQWQLAFRHNSLAGYLLNLLRATAIKKAWAIRGAVAGYLEAVFGGNYGMTAFAGLLTPTDIHANIAGCRSTREAREIARQIDVTLASDARGRRPTKLPDAKPKRPRGRPRTKPELYYGDTDVAQGMMIRRERGIVEHHTDSQVDQVPELILDEETYNRGVSELTSRLDYIQAEQKEIEKELERLRKLQGGSPLPRNLYKPPKPQSCTNGRSEVFSRFLDT